MPDTKLYSLSHYTVKVPGKYKVTARINCAAVEQTAVGKVTTENCYLSADFDLLVASHPASLIIFGR